MHYQTICEKSLKIYLIPYIRMYMPCQLNVLCCVRTCTCTCAQDLNYQVVLPTPEYYVSTKESAGGGLRSPGYSSRVSKVRVMPCCIFINVINVCGCCFSPILPLLKLVSYLLTSIVVNLCMFMFPEASFHSTFTSFNRF